MKCYVRYLATFITLCRLSNQLQIIESRDAHVSQRLSGSQLEYLAGLSNETHINAVLDNICIPRVVGTKNHQNVRKYIKNELTRLGWKVEVDSFRDKTPTFGTLNFHNIIATLNPNAERFLVLACHYDSKYYKDYDFVGATDSAVPCAMMLNLAYVMKREFSTFTSRDLSLKFIFFDGEEAFQSWGPRDSIYGAKHLARNMEFSKVLAKSGEQVNELQRVDVLVLLDLIGAANPTFYSYFTDTHKWYLRLNKAEKWLMDNGLIKRNSENQRDMYFKRRAVNANIEDDHIPFLLKGVPILHVIPTPFPEVWHTPKDNRNAVDVPTVENINKILRIFVAEYLHLSVSH